MNLVAQFPSIVGRCLLQTSGKSYERNKDILAKRFGLDGEPICTLESLGVYYDLTRERVRQVEAKAVRLIRRALSGQATPNIIVSDGLVKAYKTIIEQFKRCGFILTDTEAQAILIDTCGVPLEPGYFDLLLTVSGYVRLPRRIPGFRGQIVPCWCDCSKRKLKEAEKLMSCLDSIFDEIDPVNLFSLIVTAKRKHAGSIDSDVIYALLKAAADLELREGFVSLKFNSLRGSMDKAYRVLSTALKPMHYSDICREINMRTEPSKDARNLRVENLKNQMVCDTRFTPIGRSGYWKLSSWEHLADMTIVEAMGKTLHRSGRPLTFRQIENGVHRLRPDASERSIHAYLGEKDKFVRVGHDSYSLSAWKPKSSIPRATVTRVDDREFFNAVDDAFAGEAEIPYPKLIESVMMATGLSESGVREKVVKAEHLLVERRPGCRHKYVVVEGRFVREAVQKHKLLRTKVQEEVKSILFDSPNIPFRKIALYKRVKMAVPCKRPTFYRYLSEINDIEQYKDGNSYFVVFKNREISSQISIDLGKYEVGELLAEELQLPLSRLTKREVDIALFELGRIFENKLRAFLQAAKSAAVISVTSRDMSQLVNMVNCVVREGIVSKGYHLHILREERNDRAHGKVPTVTEREELFNKAHYIANLFVQYISFLENSGKTLQERGGLEGRSDSGDGRLVDSRHGMKK